MNLKIEDIKSLEPGKIYVISVNDYNSKKTQVTVDNLLAIAKEFNLRFLILSKDIAEIISVPEGLEIKKKPKRKSFSKCPMGIVLKSGNRYDFSKCDYNGSYCKKGCDTKK